MQFDSPPPTLPPRLGVSSYVPTAISTEFFCDLGGIPIQLPLSGKVGGEVGSEVGSILSSFL